MATLIGSHYGASTVLQLIKSKLKRFDNVISNNNPYRIGKKIKSLMHRTNNNAQLNYLPKSKQLVNIKL